MPNSMTLPDDWADVLEGETQADYFRALQDFIADERKAHTIYPPPNDVFTAFSTTAFANARVLLLGQDPYHGEDEAHGLCFSVQPGVKVPASLRNMYRELRDDIGCETPTHGTLTPWAKQGVLMINAVLTVRAGAANSHKNKGWETFTDAVIKRVSDKPEHVVFVLWGNYARKKKALVDADRHTVIESAHPSPLSAKNGFFGSRPFSKVNDALRAHEQSPIEWTLPAEPEL